MNKMHHSLSIHHVSEVQVARMMVEGKNGAFEVINIIVRDSEGNPSEISLYTTGHNTPITF